MNNGMSSGGMNASQIREHMDVVGSDGQHVGTVDKLEGDQIKLTREDPSSGGDHHRIPVSMVASVDEQVRLSASADEARRSWQAEGGDTGGFR